MKHFLFGVMKIVSQAMMWSLPEKKSSLSSHFKTFKLEYMFKNHRYKQFIDPNGDKNDLEGIFRVQDLTN